MMQFQPAPSMSTPPEPLVRACRNVITHAGIVTSALVTPGSGTDGHPLDGLRTTNPALAEALAPMLDAVMDLDARTGFLGPDRLPLL